MFLKGRGILRSKEPLMKPRKKTYLLSAVLWREGKQIVAKCPELGVSSFGKDIEEAKTRLSEAMDLYIENARALGMLRDLRETLISPERFATVIEISA